MTMRTLQDMQDVGEVINLVSDEESCDDVEENSSDLMIEDSSDDVEIISDSESSSSSIASTTTSNTTHSSWNESSQVPQGNTFSNAPQAENEIESVPSSVFIPQLVQIVSIKSEPITYGYESVADRNYYNVQVKSEVDSHSHIPEIQPKVEEVPAVAEEGGNGISHHGIEAVIAKLGTVNSNHVNQWQTVNDLPLPINNRTDSHVTNHGDQDHEIACDDLKLEKETISQGVNESEVNKTPIFCNHCGRTFYDKTTLEKHTKNHYVDYKEKCTLCGKKFRDKARLSYHMLDHTGERPFHCDLCGAGFKIMYHLQYHMFSHTNERPHVCETCGKRYKQFCHLKQHRKKHNEFFMFKCPECGKIFHGAGTLKSHRYIHTGEWPFRCQICSKGFTSLKWCEIHENKHIKTETCPVSDVAVTKPVEAPSRLVTPSTGVSTQTLFPADTFMPTAAVTSNTSLCELGIKTEIPENTPITGDQHFPLNRFLEFIR